LALHWPVYVDLLILVVLANAAPMFARFVLGDRLAFPVDGGVTFSDGQPFLGASKTVRGVVISWIVCMLGAELFGLSWSTGLLIGLAAMGGDLFSSFVKRRLRKPAGTSVVLLDQVPESLFPALVVKSKFQLTSYEIALVVGLFSVLNLALTRLLKATQS